MIINLVENQLTKISIEKKKNVNKFEKICLFNLFFVVVVVFLVRLDELVSVQKVECNWNSHRIMYQIK